MTDPMRELKIRAELLHKKAQAGDTRALARLQVLPELRRAPAEPLATLVRRRHCLTAIAVELGFASWPEMKAVLTGKAHSGCFGSLLCPARCGTHLNNWCKIHSEAAAIRKSGGGYLLAYRNPYLVVDRYYIESLGLDPDDPDWKALGFDWARPLDVAARTRLCARLVAALPREAA
ncbi:MAG TPA: hypothetical protein VEV17_19915 [Bryobacteraceae bacterium]|nr:hypothetical protein [Bryobacteraceae bacterium]